MPLQDVEAYISSLNLKASRKNQKIWAVIWPEVLLQTEHSSGLER